MAQELARIRASAGRRLIGVGTLTALGALLVYVAFDTPPASLGWQAFLVAFGGLCLWFGQILWRATALELVLTEEALSDTSGQIIARLDEIASVNRGMFAAKPSNGFVMTLHSPAPRAWRPGLWWRFGKRVAIGGVTAGHQTRPVADIISLKIQDRQHPG